MENINSGHGLACDFGFGATVQLCFFSEGRASAMLLKFCLDSLRVSVCVIFLETSILW